MKHEMTECAAAHCTDCGQCGAEHELLIVAADTGQGAWLAVLCDVCDHRRWYRGQLRRRLRDRQQLELLEELPYQ